MPQVDFWKERFDQLGIHSVGPGNTKEETELNKHKQIFAQSIQPWLDQLQGPTMDFGCGVGRWVMDLPRPYWGLDLLPDHLELCRKLYSHQPDVAFRSSNDLSTLADKSFQSIFTCTVLQHIVELELRRAVIYQFYRVLADEGVILSVEWATGQRDYDWCTSISQNDFKKLFKVKIVGEVVENGRRHTVWMCRKRKSFLSNWYK